MTRRSLHLRRLVISSMFLAVALAMRQFFSFYIPLFGESGMRIGLSMVFSIPPAILFGPFYGALVSGLNDVLNHFLRPAGAYLPLMTLIHVATGFLRGWLWLVLRGKSTKGLRFAVGLFAALMIVFSVSTIIMLRIDGITPSFFDGMENPAAVDTSDMTIMGRFLITRSQTATNPPNMLASRFIDITAVPLGFGAFALVLLLLDFLLTRYLLKEKDGIKPVSLMPLLMTLLISGVFMTTLNTILLMYTVFPSWQLLPFVVVWLPRVTQVVLTYTVLTYFLAFLLEFCKRQKTMRELII